MQSIHKKADPTVVDRIQSLLKGRTPFIYLLTEEEERVEYIIESIAKKHKMPVRHWSCLTERGQSPTKVDQELLDPIQALRDFMTSGVDRILLFKDLHLVLRDNPTLIRQIKDSNRTLRSLRKQIFFVSPHLALPDELFPLFKIEDVPLPKTDELNALLERCIRSLPTSHALTESLTHDQRDKLVTAAMGFTFNEALDAFQDALMGKEAVDDDAINSVLNEKQRLVRKSGVLEYVNTQENPWEIGGLLNLKKWLAERSKAFSPESRKLGLTPPKGILVMGVSGCGKSLCIKAIAAQWKLPLLRLDMGRLYDGLAGPPEEAMRKAIKTAEAVAPCVLWIDEIEAGIANQQQKQSGGKEARVLALFLTWMQEKTAPVFVGATANEVEVLPPEILRKGRFDELFYMGLPLKSERVQILRIHMERRYVNPADFDMDYLAESTSGLNGAEIEQGIISALFESSSKEVDLSEHILANSLRNIVPLSRTMRERIQKIESWARDRAMKASLETL